MKFTGVVDRVKYRKDGSSFYILGFKLDTGSSITVRGNIPGVQVFPGSWICFDGEYVDDKKWGRQIQISRAPVKFDVLTKNSLISLLISKGLASESLYIGSIKQNEISVCDLPKCDIPEDHIGIILECVETTRSMFGFSEDLMKIGVPEGKVGKVISVFGSSAIELIKKNPWSLSSIEGITIEEMDGIASNLGNFGLEDRILGIININMKDWCSVNSYIPSKNFLNFVTIVIGGSDGGSVEDISKAVKNGVSSGSLVVDKTVQGITAIYLSQRYNEEDYCAREIISRKLDGNYLSTKILTYSDKYKLERDEAANKILTNSADALNIVLDKDQVDGLRNVFMSPFSVITGLPGTGKSTSIKVLTHALSKLGVGFKMMAPTGVAAKRLSRVTGFHAGTIHRTLKANHNKMVSGGDEPVFSGEWEYNESNPLPGDVFIIDESSMIDQYVMTKLLKATAKKNSRMVLVGDVAQLPSVGYGNVLRDIIRSEKVPVTSLTKIYRQDEKSQIIFSSHDIHYGRLPQCKGEFQLIKISDENEVYSKILNLASETDKSGDSWQVLSPKYAGTVGVDSLNQGLRDLLNPFNDDTYSVKIFESEYRVNDKVMIIKNDYKLGVCNGDIGIIKKIGHKEKIMTIGISGENLFDIEVKFEDIRGLVRLAYACTVHKYQGMEIDVIIMPLVDSFYHQLQRNLLYTAVTRAKKRVWLIGTESALSKSVYNSREDQRDTLLAERMINESSKS